MNRLDYLIDYLLSERNDLGRIEIPQNEQDKFRLYRSLVNIRPAVKADEDFLLAEDEYLTALTESKGITSIADLSPNRGRHLSLERRHHDAPMRCYRQCRQFGNDGVLAAVSLLYRQMHTHLCGGAASLQVRSDHAGAGA